MAVSSGKIHTGSSSSTECLLNYHRRCVVKRTTPSELQKTATSTAVNERVEGFALALSG